jgi:hypothetical protein
VGSAHVAVVEIDGKTEPSMISTRGRGVRDVVWWSGTVIAARENAVALHVDEPPLL